MVASILATSAPYHLWTYSLLLGATAYQSFYNGIVAYRALPHEHFSNLQAKLFPGYFAFQAVASGILLLTPPFAATAAFYWPLGICLVGGLLNTLVLGPANRRVMAQRKAQLAKEGLTNHKDPNASAELKAINKEFAKVHGASVLINMIAFGAMAYYGVTLTNGLIYKIVPK